MFVYSCVGQTVFVVQDKLLPVVDILLQKAMAASIEVQLLLG